MSPDARKSLSMPARWKALACAVAVLLAIGFSSSATVRAQDATPAAAECVAPDLPPGGPTPADASPEAMPMEEAAEATPAAEEEEDLGTPAEGETADAILAAVQNIANCAAAGDYEGVAALLTDSLMYDEFGTTNPYDVAAAIAGFGVTFEGFQAWNPRTYEDGSVSADTQFWQSEYQLYGETMYLVQDGEYWKLDKEANLTPDYEGDSAVVGVTLGDATDEAGKVTYSITPNRENNVQTEVLLFHAINAGAVPHELVVIRLPEGADPAGLLDGSIAESDVEFIGEIAVDPGEEADMVLVGLQPGVYTLVCFFPDEAGVPHAANGMVSSFEVLAAS